MLKYITILLILLSSNYCPAINIIRDDEIESQVKAIALPIIEAAKLDKNRLKIYIIGDNKINAFTAGGTEIFINSGLIADFEDPSILQGVIAHEIGHVIAGHVVQKKTKIDELTKAASIGNIIGIIGAIATGSPDIAMGGIIGANSVLNRQLLSFESLLTFFIKPKLVIRG
jgi:predicted Zn-dependent protease